jgi:hypothetical protein
MLVDFNVIGGGGYGRLRFSRCVQRLRGRQEAFIDTS